MLERDETTRLNFKTFNVVKSIGLFRLLALLYHMLRFATTHTDSKKPVPYSNGHQNLNKSSIVTTFWNLFEYSFFSIPYVVTSTEIIGLLFSVKSIVRLMRS